MGTVSVKPLAHPLVEGLPDETWGAIVGAVVMAKHLKNPPSVDELHQYCRANLSPQKTPEKWFFGEQFPMTAIGKIQKKVLLEMVREGKITPVDRVRPSRQSSVEQVALAAQPVDTRTARTGRRWPCGR